MVLVINAAMFVVELAFGLRAGSDVATGLIADSLDVLADAGVHAISLGAVGHVEAWQGWLIDKAQGLGPLVSMIGSSCCCSPAPTV